MTVIGSILRHENDRNYRHLGLCQLCLIAISSSVTLSALSLLTVSLVSLLHAASPLHPNEQR